MTLGQREGKRGERQGEKGRVEVSLRPAPQGSQAPSPALTSQGTVQDIPACPPPGGWLSPPSLLRQLGLVGGGHLHPERLSTPRYGPLGHSGQPFCLSKAFPSAVKTPQVSSIRTRNSSWTPRSPISRTTQPLTLCPAPAELLPQLLEPPVRPHTPWQLPPGTATAHGFGDTMLTLTCCILRPVSSLPMLPLAASAQESHTHVPFTAPVSFSLGNPRRLLCLSPSLTFLLCPTWDPPLCLFLPLPSHNQVSFSPQISAPF